MKKETKEIKSKNVVIGKVDVTVFESVKEAVDKMTEKKVLSLINRQSASDTMNETRAGMTREVSPITKLARAAKDNPELEKQIANLIAKFVK